MNKVYASYIDEYKKDLPLSYFYAKDKLLNKLYGFEDRGEFTIEVLDELLELKKQKDDVVEYIKFLYIINQNINGKFSDTLWGQEILELLGEIDE